MAKESSTRSVARVISVLKCFSPEQLELTPVEISEKTNIPIATTYRLLSGLSKGRLLRKRRTTGKYCIGPDFYLIGNLFLNTAEPLSVVAPILKLLNSLTSEVVAAGILEGRYVTVILREESRHSLKFGVRVGSIFPTHVLSMGKAFLSELSEAEIDELYPQEELTRYTPRTVATKTELKRELEEIRRTGVAVNIEQTTEGIESVGAVVHDDTGAAVIALSIGVPTIRMNEEKRQRHIQLLKMASSLASYRLGYHDNKTPVKTAEEISSWWDHTSDKKLDTTEHLQTINNLQKRG